MNLILFCLFFSIFSQLSQCNYHQLNFAVNKMQAVFHFGFRHYQDFNMSPAQPDIIYRTATHTDFISIDFFFFT